MRTEASATVITRCAAHTLMLSEEHLICIGTHFMGYTHCTHIALLPSLTGYRETNMSETMSNVLIVGCCA